MKSILSLFFYLPLFLVGGITSDLNVGLRALQQIRTLVPERLAVEEFSIMIDRKSISEALSQEAHQHKNLEVPAMHETGSSQLYYSRWVVSGEPIRILDFYQEFEYGPYWLYPAAMEKLWDMHHPRTQQPQ